MAIVKLSEFSRGLEQVYRGRNDNIFSRGTSRGTSRGSRVEAYSNISRLENDNNNILHDKEKKITLKALKERENMLLSYLGGIRTPLETSTLETSIPVDNSQGDESMKYVTIKEASKMIGKSEKTVRNWIKQDKLPRIQEEGKYGMQYLIPVDVLESLGMETTTGTSTLEENTSIPVDNKTSTPLSRPPSTPTIGSDESEEIALEEIREENPLPVIYFLAVRNELECIKDILEVLVEEREERLKKKKLPWWKKLIKKITG